MVRNGSDVESEGFGLEGAEKRPFETADVHLLLEHEYSRTSRLYSVETTNKVSVVSSNA